VNVDLSLSSTDLRQSELQSLTRDLCLSLQTINGIQVEIVETEGGPGTKGDAVTVGAILLSLFGSGGIAVAVINVLKSYADRAPSMEVTLEKDGQKIVLKTGHLEGEALKRTLNDVKKFFEDFA
jgi:hypothetical protein